MSVTTRLLKNHQPLHQFLVWVGQALGGPIETRGIRLTWEGVGKDGVKAHFRVTPHNQHAPMLTAKITKCPEILPLSKFGNYEKAFTPEESKIVLTDLLRIALSCCTEGSVQLNKLEFVRMVPNLADDKVIVEFGSPNIAKPLHMGHLRSFITGHFCARICKDAGHPVTNICFLGDWGTQFGILQAGLRQDNVDDLAAVNKLSLDELLQCYVKSVQEKEKNEAFSTEALRLSAALEQGDPHGLKVWQAIRDKTINHLTSFWSMLDLEYDVVQGESEFTIQTNYTEKALKLLRKLELLDVGEDKCIYVMLPADKKFLKPMKIPLVKKDGSTLYLLRDIACALSRQENFQYNRMIYVVDKTQAQHFIALFRILEELSIQQNKYSEDDWEKKLWHISFGKVEGMSTRSGNFVLLSDVIKTGSSIMQENRLKSPNVRNADDINIATQLAISALIVNSLKMRRNRDVVFDWNEALKHVGETGVNLQYTHARLASLENTVLQQRQSLTNLVEKFEVDMEYIFKDAIALTLALQLINFEDAFWSSYTEMEPCILLNYLFRLSDKVSKALKLLKVMGEEDEKTAATRLVLFMISRRTIAVGLNTLGIKPLNEI